MGKRIYVFGCNDGESNYFDDIWYFYGREWHRSRVHLPYPMKESGEHDAILGFEHILFLFYHNKEKEVWYVDLEKEEKFLCDKRAQIENAKYAKIMIGKSNVAHSVCMNHHDTRHTVLRLNDILINK